MERKKKEIPSGGTEKSPNKFPAKLTRLVRFSAQVRTKFVLSVVSTTSLDTYAVFALLFTTLFLLRSVSVARKQLPVANYLPPCSKKSNRELSALRCAMAPLRNTPLPIELNDRDITTTFCRGCPR